MARAKPIKNAAKRAFKSLPKSSRAAIKKQYKKTTGKKMTHDAKVGQGKIVRQARLARGDNPNTGVKSAKVSNTKPKSKAKAKGQGARAARGVKRIQRRA